MNEQELKVHNKQPAQQESETTKPVKYFTPAVDIFETDNEVTIIAEMPGVDNSSVEVSLEEDTLIIRGHRNGEKPVGKILLEEYENGSYLRRFTVAEAIDRDNIRAKMAEGLLTVELAKAKPIEPRRIEVKVG